MACSFSCLKKCMHFSYDLTQFSFLFSLLSQTVSVGRRKFSANFQLVFRLIKGMIFLTFVSILVILIALPHMTVQDIVVCILAFMPTGWGMLQVSSLFTSFPTKWIFLWRGVLYPHIYLYLLICEKFGTTKPWHPGSHYLSAKFLNVGLRLKFLTWTHWLLILKAIDEELGKYLFVYNLF